MMNMEQHVFTVVWLGYELSSITDVERYELNHPCNVYMTHIMSALPLRPNLNTWVYISIR
jgi:hypothetical protein